MNAYRIQNDIVSARDVEQAIATWAEYYGVPYNSAGPVESLDPETTEISIQDEPEGEYRPGKLSEILPPGDCEPEVICSAEHEC
jgi:hypothetical protein